MSRDVAPTQQPKETWSPSRSLSDRVQRLRDEYFSFDDRDYFRNEVRPYGSGFDSFRDSLLAAAETVALPDGFWDEPLAVRRALFFRQVVRDHLPVKILDGELVVGSYFNTALSKAHTRSEAKQWRRQVSAWRSEAEVLNATGIGNCGAVPGHLIPNYPKVLRLGFEAIATELEAERRKDNDPGKEDLLRAMLIGCEAAGELADRYADEAERLAEAESDASRRAELAEIARICRKVPRQPAETFHEALQALWLSHMLVMVAESYPGPGLSPGRADQYLYPYYERDIAAGRLDREEARELLQCYWIRHNYAYDYQGRVGTNQGMSAGFGQLITLGGSGPDGEDASNDLTWLMLDVIEDMNMLEPKPNVRLHERTPEDLLGRVAGLVARSQGSPFLMNFDEASMRGLEWQGLPADRVWDYAPVGCLENTLQGNDRSGTVDVNLNLAKAVELTLNDGKDMLSGKRLGPRTGDPRTFADFAAFFGAFEKQLKALLDRIIECSNKADALRAGFEPTPYLSILVDGCAESGRDVTAGGASHNYITIEGIALATAIDSLAAVKRIVYEDARCDMDELVTALKANFEGHEELRQTLTHKTPKFGTDDPAVDALRPGGGRPRPGHFEVLDGRGVQAPLAGHRATISRRIPVVELLDRLRAINRRHSRRPPARDVPLQRRLPRQRLRPRGADRGGQLDRPSWPGVCAQRHVPHPEPQPVPAGRRGARREAGGFPARIRPRRRDCSSGQRHRRRDAAGGSGRPGDSPQSAREGDRVQRLLCGSRARDPGRDHRPGSRAGVIIAPIQPALLRG